MHNFFEQKITSIFSWMKLVFESEDLKHKTLMHSGGVGTPILDMQPGGRLWMKAFSYLHG